MLPELQFFFYSLSCLFAAPISHPQNSSVLPS